MNLFNKIGVFRTKFRRPDRDSCNTLLEFIESNFKNYCNSNISKNYFLYLNKKYNKISRKKVSYLSTIRNPSTKLLTVIKYPQFYIAKTGIGEYIIVYKVKYKSQMAKDYLLYNHTISQSPNLSVYNKLIKRLDTLILNADTKASVVQFLQDYFSTYEIRYNIGISKRMSIIFSGKPGDGKTFLAEKLYSMIADYTNLYQVRDESTIFDKASKLEPNLVGLIDDVNQAHLSRSGMYADTCANILSEMDRPNCNRIFILTTNEIIKKDSIDPAFLRPGRIEHIIDFKRPETDTRKEFFNKAFSNYILEQIKYNGSEGDVKGLVEVATEASDGYSFAQLSAFKDGLYNSYIQDGKFDFRKTQNSLNKITDYLEKKEKNEY